MTPLDIFALVVLLVIIGAVIAILVILGMMPGRIARQRNHPQAEAINMCGWWGAVDYGDSAAPCIHLGIHEPRPASATR